MDSDSCSSHKQSNRSKFKRSEHKKAHHKQHKKGPNCNAAESKKNKSNGRSNGDYDSHDEFSNKLLSQLDCRFAELSDDDEPESGKAFEELLNAPVSTSSFTFKSEKKWTWDASQFNDYFSVDVNQLSRIFNCIPFNEYVTVEEKYLNKDELTLINSSAELARKDYAKEMESFLISQQSKIDEQARQDKNSRSKSLRATQQHVNTTETMEEDLDFLLSLKEPVRLLPASAPSANSRAAEDSKGKNAAKPTKSIDLEKWLDSLLDD
ncbi:uncharacterized protein LOC107036819 [Diachasma alloeum]|uniref:uncharacterized protein LOC107036819 n=1 Tax=Diachasma alloeum TaxID=454923 RepID=UPI0007382BA6|nr:uncharacterized protein LOC107036819 [Diachasma alloeum]XP_015110503.1 uncharacterized protein LOC107036819 [Diachasma alloeum]